MDCFLSFSVNRHSIEDNLLWRGMNTIEVPRQEIALFSSAVEEVLADVEGKGSGDIGIPKNFSLFSFVHVDDSDFSILRGKADKLFLEGKDGRN